MRGTKVLQNLKPLPPTAPPPPVQIVSAEFAAKWNHGRVDIAFCSNATSFAYNLSSNIPPTTLIVSNSTDPQCSGDQKLHKLLIFHKFKKNELYTFTITAIHGVEKSAPRTSELKWVDTGMFSNILVSRLQPLRPLDSNSCVRSSVRSFVTAYLKYHAF